MKKVLLILLAAMLMLPSMMRAQGSLTVADSMATNAYIPLYGYYVDAVQHSQMIYPASMLTAMSGNKIDTLTFYATGNPDWSGNTYTVKLAIVTDSVFASAAFNTDPATAVFTGTLTVSSNMMTIALDDQFIYNGGNLLIDFETQNVGDYESNNFYGMTSVGSSIMEYGSYNPVSFKDFLPKLTFAYSTPPTCPNPSALAFSNVSDDAADFSWTSNGTETSWDIYETTTATDVPDATSTPTSTSSTTTYSMTGLTASTTYYLYVRANCGAGDVSAWKGKSVRTSQIPAELPYSQDFEDSEESAENANWDIQGTGMNQWAISTAINATSSGQKALYVSNDNGTTYTYVLSNESVSWAFRDIDFGTHAEYNLSFKVKVGGGYYDGMAVYIGVPAVPPTTAAAPQGATLLEEYSNISDWTEQNIVLGPTYTGVQRLYFRWTNEGYSYGGGNPPAAIDDIEITALDCHSPVSPVLDSITSTSISFHFTRGSELNTAWQAAIYSATDTTTVDLTDTSYTFTNLVSDTYYSIYVRTDCGEETSNWVLVTNSRTSCATIVAPYTETFAGFNDNPSPCWQQYQGMFVDSTTNLSPASYGWSFTSSNVFPVGHPKLNIYGSSVNKWLVSPAIDLSGLTTPALYFNLALTDYASASSIEDPTAQSDDKFIVGISTDDGTTWTLANATIWSNDSTGDYVYNNISNQGEDVMLSLAQYANQTIRIAFYGESTISGNGDNDLHIADVSVHELANCTRPTNLTVTGSTTTTIDVAWNAGASEDTWILEYKSDEDVDWTVVNGLTTTSYHIDNLEIGTAYSIRVKSDCGPEGESDYRELTGGAHTQACDSIDRCNLVIEMTDSYGDSWNGNKIKIYENGGFVANATVASGSTAVDTIQVCDNAAITLVWEEGSYSSEASFVVKNNYGEIVYTCTDGSTLEDGQTFYNEINHCTPPDCWKPATIDYTDASDEGFTAYWTRNVQGGNESAWNFEYKATTDSVWTSVSVVDTFYTLTGLESATYYDIRVQADCGSGSVSDWKDGVARTALCALEDQCTYTLTLTTDYGGAWSYGDGGVQVWSNGILLDTYTIENNALSKSFDLSLCHESALQLKAAVGDYWAYYGTDVTISLANTEGVVLFTQGGSSWYNNYVIYTDTMDCTPVECPRPSNLAVNAQTNTAELSWTENGTATEWMIEYRNSPDSAWTVVNATTNPYTLTGLADGYTYTLRMRALCTDTSEYTSDIRFTMGCETKTLPYTENFNSYTNISSSTVAPNDYPDVDLPMCWRFLNRSTSTGDYPQVFITSTSSYAVSGNALFFKSSASVPVVCVLPTFEQTIENLQVTFNYRNEGTSASNGTLSVGYITNPANASTFVELQAMPLNTNLTEITVLFDSVTDPTALIAFKYTGGQYDNYYMSIDNVLVEEIPTCPRPDHLAISATTTTTVSLTWDEMGSATQWEVEYGAAGYTPGSGTTETATADSVTIAGLTTGTQYDFYVRAVCGGGDNSTWRGPVTGMPGAYNMPATGTATVSMCGGTIYDDGGYDGAYSPSCNSILTVNPESAGMMVQLTGTYNTENGYDKLYIYNGTSETDSLIGMYSGSDSILVTSTTGPLTIKFTSDGSLCYSGFALTVSCVGGEPEECNVPTALAANNVTHNSATIAWVAGGTETAWNLQYKTVAATDWSSSIAVTSTPSYVLSGLTAETAYQVRVQAACSASETSDWTTVVNFTTTATPTDPCVTPSGVAATNVTYNSATINWVAGGSETAWNLQYKTASASAWSSSIVVNTTPTYALTGLTAETAYQVRVQASCGTDGTSEWSTVANFTTAAAPVDPCDAPTNLQVNSITQITAVATWTAGGDETAWNVQYKLSSATEWYNATVSTPTYTIEGLSPESEYTVQVQAKCSETNLSGWVSKTFTTLSTGVSSVELANSISIMPNPAESYIELTINSNVNVKEATIYNAFGQMIQKVALNDNHARIDVSNMAAGMYFVRIANDNNMATKKFIKK